VIDCASGHEIHRLTPPDGRQFNGHGAFSGDGALLYTSEVVAETSEGRIGIWDCAGFVRRGEWASGGIGPHDIKGMADGSLVVANGGIATDPDDRSKLNLPSMHPNLTQLSAGGEILAQASLAPDLLQNSIRHLALLPDGRIAFAMQWEGDPAEIVPLLGLWTPGAAPVLCAAPEGEAPRMKGYAGSVAATAEGTLAMTSPKGGVAQLFDAFGTFLATVPRADVCGIAALDADSFLASDGSGSLMRLTPAGPQVLMQGVVAWDNHIVRIAPVA
jgi:uncharacterized protein